MADKLAKMADLLELGSRSDANHVKAHAAIEAVAKLNEAVGIKHTLDVIKREDIPAIATRAVKEGATFPVPRLMDQQQCEDMIKAMCA